MGERGDMNNLTESDNYGYFLCEISNKEYAEFWFEGGKIVHNNAVTLDLDIVVNSNRLRLDLYLGDGKGFCDRFPNLPALRNYVTYMVNF